VTVQLLGMRWICSWVMTKIESVPGVLVTLSPWERFPNSFPKAHDHVVAVIGSSMRFLYLVIDSPVMGCMTGAQTCLHVHGMAWDVVRGAYVWMAIADRAALEYSRGVRRAMRGDLRGANVSSVSVGSSKGAGLVVGVTMGSLVGVTLFRICR
jgi:hypothetical protein